MPERFVVAGLGGRVAVDVDESKPELVDAFRTAWSRCLVSDDASMPETPIELYLGDETDDRSVTRGASRISGVTLADVLQRATQSVTMALIRQRAGELTMFHAAALAHPVTGESVVLVAPGGTGKTTAARTLGVKYGYLTDETVAIDADDHIWPYPKPLSLRVAGQDYKVETSPDALGLADAALIEPHVHAVALLRREPEAAQATVERLDLFDAVAQLAPETSSLSKVPSGGLQRLAALAERTGGIERWTYAEASSLAPLLASRIGEVV